MSKIIISIHQPNYFPWLGYFYKIMKSDYFVILDDVQYTKNSYINRSQVLAAGGAKWLTVPVSYSFGDLISQTYPAKNNWSESHLSSLRNYYRPAKHFEMTWSFLKDVYAGMPQGSLAHINTHLIKSVMDYVGIETEIILASSLNCLAQRADERLVAIIQSIDGSSIYLSGSGGRKYQSEDLFEQAGIELQYSNFVPLPYEQGEHEFVPGLSVIDALFHIGPDATRACVATGAFE